MADIIIVDYGAGNLRSVANAMRLLGHEPEVSNDPQHMVSAPIVILPGVGAASSAMKELERLNLADALRYRAKQRLPLLGVCLGMQLLMSASDEGGMTPCLNIIPGTVHKLPESGKVPHMGWNQVRQYHTHQIFDGTQNNTPYYFVHSYYIVPDEESVVMGQTEYGVEFCSILVQNSVVATQFHPEKSGANGFKIYDNFIKMALGGCLC